MSYRLDEYVEATPDPLIALYVQVSPAQKLSRCYKSKFTLFNLLCAEIGFMVDRETSGRIFGIISFNLMISFQVSNRHPYFLNLFFIQEKDWLNVMVLLLLWLLQDERLLHMLSAGKGLLLWLLGWPTENMYLRML